MEQEHRNVTREEEMAGRIFSISASMVGICLTAIGLLHISNKMKALNSFADEILAFDAAGFLVSCLLSHFALKTGHIKLREWIARTADYIFLVGLCVMVLICGLVAYELM